MPMGRSLAVTLTALFVLPALAGAEVELPALFSDHMVLQQGMPVPVWGWAAPGEEVKVEFAGQRVAVRAGEDGRWMVRLTPLDSARAQEMKVTGKNALTVKDILVGEVWLCSGQSNMAQPMTWAFDGEAESALANYPEIRFFTVAEAFSAQSQSRCGGKWVVCDPQSVKTCAAVAYHFGREIHVARKAPVGLIVSAKGNTLAESWSDPTGFSKHPELARYFQEWQAAPARHAATMKTYADNVAWWRDHAIPAVEKGGLVPPMPQPPSFYPQHVPGHLYGGMIAPLVPVALRGVTWYQGESNALRADYPGYGRLFTTLIEGWRARWGQGDLPFLFVQIANFNAPNDPNWAFFREQQQSALALPKTAMAVAIDVGETNLIDPRHKKPVGVRLSLLARALVYGEPVVCSGPVFEKMEIEAGKARLHFKNIGGGLVGRADAKGNAKLRWFEIAGEDRTFVLAEAVLEGDTVLVSSDKVAQPVAVRYAWHNSPDGCNLYNKEGLPAVPFRTDHWVKTP